MDTQIDSEPDAKTQLACGAGVPPDSKTSDYYRTYDIPKRFDNPDWFKGYSQSKPVHPIYRTSNSDYGSRPPSVHTMPTRFAAKSQEFSEQLGSCGMYKNHSLNTAVDSSNVPDH